MESGRNHRDACLSGQRPSEDILRVIRKETPTSLKIVYNRFLRREPKLGGKVTAKFYIKKDGSVALVLPMEDTTDEPQFANAILTEVFNWRFAASGCNGYDIVAVPFTFAP